MAIFGRQAMRGGISSSFESVEAGQSNLDGIVKRSSSYIDFRKFSRKKKIHFFVNIGVGIIIALFFHFLEHTKGGEDILNTAFDRIIAMEAEKAAKKAESLNESKDKKKSEQILFVDIDHDTYKNWGKPLLTPRDELAKIIETAYTSNAKAIVLDILFEDKDCCNLKSDRNLRKVLQDMTNKEATTKVIFPVRITYDGDIKKNLFDDLIEKNPNFYTAVPNIYATATDRIIRYWMPYEKSKNTNRNYVLWNVSLLAAVLANEKIKELKDIENKISTQQFAEGFSIKTNNGKHVYLSAKKDDLYRNRIRFLLVPRNTMTDHWEGNLREVYTVDQSKHVSFKDKIVIIGNSSPDAGDIYSTPIGNMAGMYIIGNAVNTILLGLQPSHSSVYVNIAIEVLVIILAAYFFLYFASLLAQILVSFILILTLGVISYYYFLHTGIFLNFMFAVVGMSFHKTISNIEEIIENRGQKHA